MGSYILRSHYAVLQVHMHWHKATKEECLAVSTLSLTTEIKRLEVIQNTWCTSVHTHPYPSTIRLISCHCELDTVIVTGMMIIVFQELKCQHPT